MTPTVDELLADARRRLAAAPFRPPTREAALLLGHVLGWSEAEVLGRGERPVEDAAAARFAELLARRLAGEPVAYLFAEREFYGRPFHVDRRVLIPRPESEHLVEAALARLRGRPLDRPRLLDRLRLLDVGTGSGCLAVTLALELPAAEVIATDLSAAALAVAAANVRRHAVGARVRLAACDLLAGVDATAFDLVVSNPPYVGRGEAPHLSPEVVDHEPAAALFADDEGGDAGIAAYSRLFAQAAALSPGTWLLVEIGHRQLAAVRRRAAASGLQVEGVVEDYAGIPRVVELRRP